MDINNELNSDKQTNNLLKDHNYSEDMEEDIGKTSEDMNREVSEDFVESMSRKKNLTIVSEEVEPKPSPSVVSDRRLTSTDLKFGQKVDLFVTGIRCPLKTCSEVFIDSTAYEQHLKSEHNL